MLRRVHELLAVTLLLGGLLGIGLCFYFLYYERFIEGFVAGLLAFVLLRTGLLCLRLLVARTCLDDSHRRILESLGEGMPKDAKGRRKQPVQ